MASRIMHLTVSSLLLAECTVKNPGALLAGSMLPDAMLPGQNSRASHFVAERDGRRTYDVSEFRRLFGQDLGGGRAASGL